MSDDLKERVHQFSCLTLPGQPVSMHMGTSYLVHDLWKEVERLRAEVEALREDYLRACKTVAEMHAAAVGEIRGPAIGVVEDVAALRAKVEALRARYERVITLLDNNRSAYAEDILSCLADENAADALTVRGAGGML